MKTKLSCKTKQLANTLVVVLVTGSILALAVAGYLSLVEQQNLLNARSQSWNIAIAVAEAGVEEGLQALNSKAADGSTVYGPLTRALADGNSYSVVIYRTNADSPTIESRAQVQLPALAQISSPVCFAAIAAIPTTASTAPAVSRAVRVRCARGHLYAKAMVAKLTIDMNGNDIMCDSFDSENPLYSTGHLYDPSKRRDNGDVASNDTIVNSVSVGNARIYGHVATGPGGTVYVGSQGAIGPLSWPANGGICPDPGWVRHDSSFTFPDTSLPDTSGWVNPPAGTLTIATVSSLPSPIPPGLTTNTTSTTTLYYPSPGTYLGSVTINYHQGNSGHVDGFTYNLITGYSCPVALYTYPTYKYTYNLNQTNVTYRTNSYTHVLEANNSYVASDLSGSTLVWGSNVDLALPNGLNMGSSDTFTIEPGANVEVYAGGTSCTVSGNGIINPDGLAASFILKCAPSVTSFALNGNADLTGVVVAPNADVQLNGGGSSSITDFTGALIANSVTLNGHFNFHYDEALGRMPATGRYLITTWEEIRP